MEGRAAKERQAGYQRGYRRQALACNGRESQCAQSLALKLYVQSTVPEDLFITLSVQHSPSHNIDFLKCMNILREETQELKRLKAPICTKLLASFCCSVRMLCT